MTANDISREVLALLQKLSPRETREADTAFVFLIHVGDEAAMVASMDPRDACDFARAAADSVDGGRKTEPTAAGDN